MLFKNMAMQVVFFLVSYSETSWESKISSLAFLVARLFAQDLWAMGKVGN
jgi:hypothetical protein